VTWRLSSIPVEGHHARTLAGIEVNGAVKEYLQLSCLSHLPRCGHKDGENCGQNAHDR
jgi:hypothetical protein